MTNESKEPLLMSTLIEEDEEKEDLRELNDDNHNLILKSDKLDKRYQDCIRINMKSSPKADEQNLLKSYIDKAHRRHVQLHCVATALFYALCSFLILVINKIVLTVYR